MLVFGLGFSFGLGLVFGLGLGFRLRFELRLQPTPFLLPPLPDIFLKCSRISMLFTSLLENDFFCYFLRGVDFVKQITDIQKNQNSFGKTKC